MRDLGQWKEAVDEFQNAIRLDPRNTLVLSEAATTYSRLRRYEDGIAAWDRVLALDSGNVLAKALRGQQYLRLGIIDSLAATVERLPPESWMATWSRYTVLRVQRRHADVLAMLDDTRHTTVGDAAFYRPIILLRAMTLDAMGKPARARPAYEAARALLEDSVRAHPLDARMHIALGLAYAGIGRKARAIAHAQRAMDLTPLSSASMRATAFMGDAVQVFIKVGEYDKAIGLIGLLLSMHAGREISVPLLILDPMFDPLRGDPRFERLLVQYSRPRAV